jgi:hypothetical protein
MVHGVHKLKNKNKNRASLSLGGYNGRSVALTTHPHLRPRLEKEQNYTSTSPQRLHGLFQNELSCLSEEEGHSATIRVITDVSNNREA